MGGVSGGVRDEWGVSERGECGEKEMGGMSVGVYLRIE